MYSISSFLTFVKGEMADELLSNPTAPASFTSDMSVGDAYTDIIKNVDSNLTSLDHEALINKLSFLDLYFVYSLSFYLLPS